MAFVTVAYTEGFWEFLLGFVLTYVHVGSIARGRRNLTSPVIGGHLLPPYSEVEAGLSQQVIEGQRSKDKSLG